MGYNFFSQKTTFMKWGPMKRNFLRIFASIVILSFLLPSSSIQARQTIASTAAPAQEVVSDVDPTLPEGLTSSEWQSIQNQIMSNLSQQAYLKASNTDASDEFGFSVAVSNDTIVVGARGESSAATGVNGDQNDNSASNAGAAYVFVRNGTTWTQQAYLKASNTDANDHFGKSVAISNDTIVVGSPYEASAATGVDGDQNDNSANRAGAAYVFVRNGTTWTQQAYLKASLTDAFDLFGTSVAVSNNTIVVGAYGEDSAATGVDGDQNDNNAGSAGAAYVFVRDGTTWTQQAYLKASNTGVGDQFGYSVAVSNDTIVVGARGESSAATGVNGDQNDNSASNAGAAYVFVRNGTTWTQQAYLKASNTDADDHFGYPVAVSNDTIVVGAWPEDSATTGVNGDQINNSAVDAGAAYVFVRDGTTWTQQAYLKASNTDAYDGFGGSVAVSNDTIVVSANLEDSAATGVNGDQINNSAVDAGAAYVFVRDGTTWTQQAYIKASNTDADDYFGLRVAVSNDTIVVGALGEASAATGINGDQNDNSAQGAGAAYVFVNQTEGPARYSGVIKDDHDNPWANVDILLGDGRTTKTNADGYYEFDVTASGELTVIPIRIDYRFAPLNGKVSWPDKPTQDFIIRPLNPEPFLGLPFDPNFSGYTEEQSFYIAISGNIDGTGESGKVNSWFDHDSPVYNYDSNSYLLRWDGQPLPNPNGDCSYGDSCYDGHDGIDFHEGQEILAAGDGDIVFAGWGCLGNHVIIDHNNGYFTVYGHLRNTPTLSGHVIQGDVLGLAGSTAEAPCSSDGTHLHFAVYYDNNGNRTYDRYVDKVVDPFGWYPINSSLSDPWSTRSDYLWNYSNSAAFTVTPAGTTQTSLTNFWTMQIPAGAVAEDVNLEILENPSVGPALVDYLFTGQNFLVRLQDGPTPQTETNYPTADNEVHELLVPATLTATYLPSQLPHHDLSNLAIFQWDDIGLTWTQLASTINTIDNTISAQTSNFGQFTLQAPLVCSNAVNEPNDKYDVATYLVENSDLAFDNFDIETDEDWFRLRASKGNKYEISLSEISLGIEVKFEFYDKDGITLLFESYDPASIEWWAPDSGTYFIRVIRQTGGDFGCESTYSIELIATYYSFIPAIQR